MSLEFIKMHLSDAARSVDEAVSEAFQLGDKAIYMRVEDVGGDISQAIHELSAVISEMADDKAAK